MTQAEALALVNKAWTGKQAHYEGCWRVHHACAIAEVERLTKELEALRHEQSIS
jgi:hypothetical protein